MKVLFLDIDGVLNSTRTVVAFGQGFPHTLDRMDLFDNVALTLIRKLCYVGDISIVLSSTWRMIFPFHDIANALDLPIMGATDTKGRLRGEEIGRWLSAHLEVTTYAIVDDDSDMLDEQLPFFVQTNGDDGLSWANYQALCDIFNLDSFALKPARDTILEAP